MFWIVVKKKHTHTQINMVLIEECSLKVSIKVRLSLNGRDTNQMLSFEMLSFSPVLE